MAFAPVTVSEYVVEDMIEAGKKQANTDGNMPGEDDAENNFRLYDAPRNIGSSIQHAIPVVTVTIDAVAKSYDANNSTWNKSTQVLYCPTPMLNSVSEEKLSTALEMALKYSQ